MRGLVREHRLTDDVADRVYRWDVRAQVAVNADEAPIVHGNAGGAGAHRRAVRPATNRDQDAVVDLGVAA